MQNHDERQSFGKIYLSLYMKGLCVRGSWRPNRTATYWPPLSWPSAFLSRSPGLLNRGPEAQPLWVLVFSTASYLQLVWSPTAQSGVPRAPSVGRCFLYSTISPTLLNFKNSLNFLCTELYNSSTPTQSLPITGHQNMHFCRLWNGMFDSHRAEITVMQFTGHPLPVHQFVTVPWDFNPVPYCQLSSPTPMEYALPPSLEWHAWPGRRSIYYNSWNHLNECKQLFMLDRNAWNHFTWIILFSNNPLFALS